MTGDVDSSRKSSGFLSSLLQDGCECEGYNVRIVGHSLGGAIAALLGIRVRILLTFLKHISIYSFTCYLLVHDRVVRYFDEVTCD